ncbi:MAG: hypothetical protein E6R03_16915 [Hyphomicrobiaceae bacterium]|nr:MAG: hypothetical protein E6R03_16915 [Hyphomicrobiaceae bacterium]
MKQKLWDHQLRARELKREALRKYGSTVCVSPCGSGKGTMIADDAIGAVSKGHTVQISVYRRILVEQIAERLQLNGIRYSVQMPDLPDKPWAIRDQHADVIVSSRDTMAAILRNGGEVRRSDLHIIDECHGFETLGYQTINKAVQPRWLLGYTATPVRPDGMGLSNRVFKSMVEAAKIEELIEKGMIVPVEVYVPVKTAKRRRSGLKISANGDPIQQWMSHAYGLRTVTFCSNIAESKMVRSEFVANGIAAEHVDANTPREEREAIFTRLLLRETLVVCNVGIADVGWDFPALECVQLLTKCGSPIAYWQKTGRVARNYLDEQKSRGVLLDHSAAMAEHGWPNLSPLWELSDREPIQKRQQERFGESAPSDAKPIICNKCGRGSIGLRNCPCGNPLFRDSQEKPETAGENLSLIGDAAEFAVGKKNYQKEWTNILYMAANHPTGSKSFAWAASIFKNKFHDWPEKFSVTPTVPFDERKRSIVEVYPQFMRRREAV